jgi:cobalt-zinc-cadmium efflux system protein
VHDHAHNHHRHHHHNHGRSLSRALNWSLVATLAFVVVEAVAGIQAHSLALLSDAGHNFTDALALLLASLAYYFESKPADNARTYGYHRAGVLAAFVNALTLLALSVWIFQESYQRLRNPEPVAEGIMLWVSGLGLVLNAGVMWSLWRGKDRDLNIRAAWIHMLGDALGSVAIMIGAVVIRYTGWQVIDPLLSVLIAFLIVWTAWDIVRDTLNILLEGLPRGMKLDDVAAAMRAVPGVLDVHHLHVWSLGSSTHALSAHVVIRDIPPSESGEILERLDAALKTDFEIRHSTIQFEHEPCAAPGDCAGQPI